MTNEQIEIQSLRGEIRMLRDELALMKDQEEARVHGDYSPPWWAEEMLFWRTKYLRDHPEHANTEYVRNARERERIDPMMFL